MKPGAFIKNVVIGGKRYSVKYRQKIKCNTRPKGWTILVNEPYYWDYFDEGCPHGDHLKGYTKWMESKTSQENSTPCQSQEKSIGQTSIATL